MLEGVRILLIDDTPDVVDTLMRHFSAAGAVPTSARTYADALEAIEHEVPDIALVDIDLMGQSGIELIKTIQQLPPPHPFFAILTNSSDVMDVAKAVDLDVTTFIQKTDHDPDEIVRIVAQRYTK